MNLLKVTLSWLKPPRQLLGSIVISALAGSMAFRPAQFDQKTLITFVAFYLILAMMWLLFTIKAKLADPKTRQLLQLGYVLLGFVLMLTGVLGLLNGNLPMIAVFILMLFLPGLALLRCGLHFNRDGENI